MDPDLEIVFRGIRDALSIGADQWERITGLVTLQLMLDSHLFIILMFKLSLPLPNEEAKERLIKYLVPMSFDARVNLAEAAGFLPPAVASGARAVNTVRNKLVHYRAQPDVPEIATEAAFHALVARGLRAYEAMAEIVIPYRPQSAQP